MVKRWKGDTLIIIKTQYHGYRIQFNSSTRHDWSLIGCTFRDVFNAVQTWKKYKQNDYFEPGRFEY